MILPLTKSKFKTLEIIHDEPGIKISDLIKKAKLSPRVAYDYLRELKKADVIYERIIGKKPVLRLLYPRYESEEGIQVFGLIETEKMHQFLGKHKELVGSIKQLKKELEGLKDVITVIVFGSFARGVETKESDLDMLFITRNEKIKEKIDSICERCFVTIKNPLSARIISEKEFVDGLKREEAFVKTIKKDHIVIYNSSEFIKILSV